MQFNRLMNSSWGVHLRRVFTWSSWILFALVVLVTLMFLLGHWNWLRAPMERYALEKTGRELIIQGDLKLKFNGLKPRLLASQVTFANPAWAKEPQMLTAESVEVTLDLLKLFNRQLVLPVVHLTQANVNLEQSPSGRRSWLLDLDQRDESAQVEVGQITLDQAQVVFDDVAEKTHVRALLVTDTATADPAVASGLNFTADGQLKGQALKAKGTGGPILQVREDRTPYPLKVEVQIGRTSASAQGSVTHLFELAGLDMRFKLRGDSLDQIFPIIGIAAPATRAYAMDGHLVHSGSQWNYEKFTGKFGDSDLAGSIQLETSGARPFLTANLTSKILDIEDLGPIIGARPGSVTAARAAQAPEPTGGKSISTIAPLARNQRVLPDLPFKTDRWDSLDADLKLRAVTILRAKALPLDNMQVHLLLRDSVLTLAPLEMGFSGGRINATVTLDGRKQPIEATANVKLQKLDIAKLLPLVERNKGSIGEVNGSFALGGVGNSVGRMLAASNGRVSLVVTGGKISKLTMERLGLHLWEILAISLSGDRLVELRCALADFEVKQGVMRPSVLVLDTQVTTIFGTGSIDLGEERIDLVLNQKTKKTSPLALRSPIFIRGSFAQPVASVDTTQVIARGLGAVVLGLVNPVLALLPLVDPGPGADTQCAQLVETAKRPVPAAKPSAKPSAKLAAKSPATEGSIRK